MIYPNHKLIPVTFVNLFKRRQLAQTALPLCPLLARTFICRVSVMKSLIVNGRFKKVGTLKLSLWYNLK